jgi:hypothetical protein
MISGIQSLLGPEWLVYMAGGIFVLAYLIIHQWTLRIMVMIGTMLYIAYYATVGDTPLWGAIYTSVAMGLANAIGMFGLYARNAKWAIPAHDRDLYDRFSSLPPGDFRTVMRAAKRYHLDERRDLTTEGAIPKSLFYVISGELRMTKRGDPFTLPADMFIGEVGYLLNCPASATVHLAAGAEVLEWDGLTLSHLSVKAPQFKLALDAIISRIMAEKIALALAPDKS